jgi:hypothetical protein
VVIENFSIADASLEEILPRLLDIKGKVDMGGKLDEADTRFMSQISHSAAQSKLLETQPSEWQKFYAEVLRIYEEIVNKALNNVEKTT